MSAINFQAKLTKIGSWTILRLPENASSKLPSRGLTYVSGTINGHSFHDALEPDGKKSHWLKVDKTILDGAHAEIGDTVTLAIEPVKEWPEPEVPEDLMKALKDTPDAYKTWMDITPLARWDWIRWIRSTKNPETRKKRIGVTFSKFKKGLRRPCCFNRSSCTVPDISHNGILLDPNP